MSGHLRRAWKYFELSLHICGFFNLREGERARPRARILLKLNSEGTKAGFGQSEIKIDFIPVLRPMQAFFGDWRSALPERNPPWNMKITTR